MPQNISKEVLQQALDNCAEEPVHIPGIIQPFGWLLAYHRDSFLVQYASDNAAELLDQPIQQVLGEHVRDLFGRELWHALQNFIATAHVTSRRVIIGSWHAADDGKSYLVAAWPSHDFVVMEFEAQPEAPQITALQAQEQTLLIEQVQSRQNVQSLLDLATRQLRHLTGFDRVMVYQFDHDWNGEVVAEAHSSKVEPFLGLNFPSFDIPSQAREIMARIPLRIIADVYEDDVPISAANNDLPPLDISLGETRGTSKIHMQYLRNMGSHATMTLSIVVEGKLWGIISFHHLRPRVTPVQIRMVLKSFLDVFCLKLGLLLGKKFNQLSDEISHLYRDIQGLMNTEAGIPELFAALGAKLSETFQASGFCIQSENNSYTYGRVPNSKEIDALLGALTESDNYPYFTENLSEMISATKVDFAPIAGVAAVRHSNDWMLLIFREEVSQSVAWAGNPEKVVEFVEGEARLSPRGSFSTFLAQTQGKSKPWTGEDRSLVEKLWPLLSAELNSELKQRYMKDLHRQQELMIDELNHRVRNILALVQAVSTEAKKSESSLESYSKAIESRIRALAAAHSIGSGSSAKQVDISEIIWQEAKPYESEANARVHLSGTRRAIQADLAPIFALTIHELMTNAAKYGALSNSTGSVDVVMQLIAGELEITWIERGGPTVVTPLRQGFGTTLIKRAVPYELGGKSALIFAPAGVQARILLPPRILSDTDHKTGSNYTQPQFSNEVARGPEIPTQLKAGIALVVEDNFMIAEGVTQQLNGLGFSTVESASNVESALDFLEYQTPSFAILDVNLGNGKTSLPIAEVLLGRQVPFIFATGYGEISGMPPHLLKMITLTKPVDGLELANALERILG